MKVKFVDLSVKEEEFNRLYLPVLRDVFTGGMFVGGEEVSLFESEFAGMCGSKYAVAVNSGTDSLFLALKAQGIGEGDEVITVSNSFIATANAIKWAGADAVFADVGDDLLIDPQSFRRMITGRTKAVIPVHLTGLMCDMDAICRIADEYGIKVLEDAAQSVCAEYKGRRAGTFGAAGCFSMHPLKNLAGVGDGGVITTDDADVAERLRMMRNNGLADRDNQKIPGTVSRMDTLNAAVLRVRMRMLGDIINERRRRAALYRQMLPASDSITFQTDEQTRDRLHTYHTFAAVAEDRDSLMKYLYEQGVETKIHYPLSIHRQPVFADCRSDALTNTERLSGRIISLPIANVTDDDIAYVCRCVRKFYGEN